MPLYTETVTVMRTPTQCTNLGYIYCGDCLDDSRPITADGYNEVKLVESIDPTDWPLCDACEKSPADWPQVEVTGTVVIETTPCRIF